MNEHVLTISTSATSTSLVISRHCASTLAYVTNWTTKWGWRDLPSQALLPELLPNDRHRVAALVEGHPLADTTTVEPHTQDPSSARRHVEGKKPPSARHDQAATQQQPDSRRRHPHEVELRVQLEDRSVGRRARVGQGDERRRALAGCPRDRGAAMRAEGPDASPGRHHRLCKDARRHRDLDGQRCRSAASARGPATAAQEAHVAGRQVVDADRVGGQRRARIARVGRDDGIRTSAAPGA